MEIKPQDILITTLNTGSAWVPKLNGIIIYYKPLDKYYECTAYDSLHRNKAVCMRMLEEDLCYL